MSTDILSGFPFKDFYALSDKDVKGCIWLLPSPDPQIEYPGITENTNVNCNTYTVSKGKIWTDVIYCGWPGLYVVSRRVHDTLVNTTGIYFYPVTILDKEFKLLNTDYFGLCITGRCGGFVESLSRIELTRLIPTGPEFTKKVGLYFDPSTWDGNDFFVPEGTAYIFASKRANDLIVESRFTNVFMRQIVEIEVR